MQTSNHPSTESADLLDRWKELASLVDAKLDECLLRLTADCPGRLSEAMRYSLMSPGKRLRPILCLLTSEALGGDIIRALPASAALEMIHCYSLIHDDLPAMDDDDLRRGRPTCHVQFDEATAILAGDGLLTLAFETIAKDVSDGVLASQSCFLLAKACGPEGMVGGQMDDLLSERLGGNGEKLQTIHARKTGAMIRASVVLGGLSANADDRTLAILAQYGDNVGIAFQIADDLLDVEGTSENTGKRTGKDQDRGKLTYPGIFGIQASRQRAEQHVARAIELIDALGPTARPLKQLARYITDRSH